MLVDGGPHRFDIIVDDSFLLLADAGVDVDLEGLVIGCGCANAWQVDMKQHATTTMNAIDPTACNNGPDLLDDETHMILMGTGAFCCPNFQ